MKILPVDSEGRISSYYAVTLECDEIEPTVSDLEQLAEMLGFCLEYDNDGQVVLYTNVYDEDKAD